ncbi:hypothetical protein CR513_20230, partial [Mucuna pruriens]
MKHPTEDHSLFGIDLIDELVEECLQLDSSSEDSENFAGGTDSIGCLGSITEEVNYGEVHDLFSSKDDSTDLVDLIGQLDPKASDAKSSSSPPLMELKSLPSHLKYAYLVAEQQLPIIIANNLHQKQEDKLLQVLRQHKKAIGWKLCDLPRINPSICIHRILMEGEAKPIRQHQRRVNPTILDVVKKEVTKLLATRIVYPI